MAQSQNILLLAGGESIEREVSLQTSWAINKSLLRQGYTVKAYDPATGGWLKPGKDGFDCESIPPGEARTNLRLGKFDPRGSDFEEFDLAYIGLHGGMGENGTVQGLLDLSGLPYTGSGMAASAMAMDKPIAKRLMKAADILTPAWTSYNLDHGHTMEFIAEDIRKFFGFPIIIKPADGGSTLGLSFVENLAGLKNAIEKVAEVTPYILVETYIDGREIAAAVLDGESLPLVEIIPQSGLYDYKAKYSSGESTYIVPAGIDDALARIIRGAASDLYRLIGATGAARVDLRLTDAGVFYILELNTLPGMHELGLVPMAAKAAGIEFDALVDRIVQSALPT